MKSEKCNLCQGTKKYSFGSMRTVCPCPEKMEESGKDPQIVPATSEGFRIKRGRKKKIDLADAESETIHAG